MTAKLWININDKRPKSSWDFLQFLKPIKELLVGMLHLKPGKKLAIAIQQMPTRYAAFKEIHRRVPFFFFRRGACFSNIQGARHRTQTQLKV